MEKQQKYNLLALVFTCSALPLQLLGVYGSTATQSSLSVVIPFWFLQVPISILLIIYLSNRFKKTQDVLYYIILGGLFLAFLLPFFNTFLILYVYSRRIRMNLSAICATYVSIRS